MIRESKPFSSHLRFSRTPQGIVGKLLTALLSVGLLILGVMFSLVALAVAAVIGLAFAGWFWWKTRALRQVMREAAPTATPAAHAADGEIIDGECVRESEPRELLR
ncbi:hypothetical protein [Azonexus sp.]|uniref:hypothetical protein n=1 Tax=Azonexus sp. TaxID=1872668 RepID=UPI0035B2FCD6